MAIPLLARSGGLLIAVPEPYLDNDVLLDAAMNAHDGVLVRPKSSRPSCVRKMMKKQWSPWAVRAV